jgi:hypothetical protein
MSEWSRSWSATPDTRRFDSGCGLVRHPLWLSQAGAGCPSAPHKGGAPGSTPGPATDGRDHRSARQRAAVTGPGRPPVRSLSATSLGDVTPTRAPERTRRVPKQKTALPGAKANRYFDWYESACEADAWVQVPQAGRRPDLGKPTTRYAPPRCADARLLRGSNPRAPTYGRVARLAGTPNVDPISGSTNSDSGCPVRRRRILPLPTGWLRVRVPPATYGCRSSTGRAPMRRGRSDLGHPCLDAAPAWKGDA